jgi:signal transduction histidine kinase
MAGSQVSVTAFAPAARAPAEEVQRQARYFADQKLLCHLLDAMPHMVVILNQQRQIVYANALTYQQWGGSDDHEVLGLRPGELVGCIHALECECGCGTTLFCSQCGAVRAILAAQRGQAQLQDCHILRGQDQQFGALDLRVLATPFVADGESFVIFTVSDVSAENRRKALERIFFHDVLNTAGVLRTAVDFLAERYTADPAEVLEMVGQLTDQLIDEIQAQRNLAAAEAGELVVEPEPIHALALLRQIREIYLGHPVAEGKTLQISGEDVVLVSDLALLQRVIVNMMNNALEASLPGQTITLGCRGVGDAVEFWVHNPTAMRPEVQLQVFDRSYSTKGAGRGLGTYSMKLLSERYLAGQVSFSSSEEAGTTFRVKYPARYPLARQVKEVDG